MPTPRHMDDHRRLSPEAHQKLCDLTFKRGRATVRRMLGTSAETLDNIMSPGGGAKQRTILRIEAELAKLPPV